jgi:hypothetical protein
MFNPEQTPNAPSEKQEQRPEASALEQSKREAARMAQDVPPSIDATPLSSERKRPKVETPEGAVDISDSTLLRETCAQVLERAKRNMRSEREYGDTREITVDNTQFILAKNADGIPYVSVNVYGLSSGDVITQSVPLQEKDEQGALAYLNPPVAKGEEPFLDQAIAKLA